MSDTPETLDKIIAEMHDFCSGWSEDVDVTVKVGLIYGWECRLDAAAERERNAHTNDIHNALYKATGISGNAAAMRDALEQALAYCESDQKSGIAYSDNDVLVPMLRAALSVAARNCDRPECADVESAWATYCAETNRADCKGFARWLFAPALEGETK